MNEIKCTKENLSKTIKYIEDNYELLDVKMVTGYFSNFSHFKITFKGEYRGNRSSESS